MKTKHFLEFRFEYRYVNILSFVLCCGSSLDLLDSCEKLLGDGNSLNYRKKVPGRKVGEGEASIPRNNILTVYYYAMSEPQNPSIAVVYSSKNIDRRILKLLNCEMFGRDALDLYPTRTQ